MLEKSGEFAQKYQQVVRRWRTLYGTLISLHFILGFVAIAAPIAISTHLFGDNTVYETCLGFAAATAAAVITFLRPDRYAQGFLAAYSALEVGLDRFLYSTAYKGDIEG